MAVDVVSSLSLLGMAIVVVAACTLGHYAWMYDCNLSIHSIVEVWYAVLVV